MNILYKIWNFYKKYSSIILIILIINLLITCGDTNFTGIYFWISDILLFTLSLIQCCVFTFLYFKNKK